MSNLAHLPIFRATLLTVVITGMCAWLLASDPQGTPLVGMATAQEPAIESPGLERQQAAIEALNRRVSWIEGELSKVSGIEEATVEEMFLSLRSELADLRLQRTNSPDLPLPLADYSEVVLKTEPPATPDTVIQEFEFRGSVAADAVVVVQGSDPHAVVSMELFTTDEQWVEIYQGPDRAMKPTSETWLEFVEKTPTTRIRIEVEGSDGIEAVGLATEQMVHWSMASN